MGQQIHRDLVAGDAGHLLPGNLGVILRIVGVLLHVDDRVLGILGGRPAFDGERCVIIGALERRIIRPDRPVAGLGIQHALGHSYRFALVVIRLADGYFVFVIEGRGVQVLQGVAHLDHRGAVAGDGEGIIVIAGVAAVEREQVNFRLSAGCAALFHAAVKDVAAVGLLHVVLHRIQGVIAGREHGIQLHVSVLHRGIRPAGIEDIAVHGRGRYGLLVFQPVRDGLDGHAVHIVVDGRLVALAGVIEVGHCALALDDGDIAREGLFEAI